MPAADIPPNNNSTDAHQRALNHDKESTSSLPTEKNDEWVTVDFPNAISVDSIPFSQPENDNETKTEKLILTSEPPKEEGKSLMISSQEKTTIETVVETEKTKEPATIIQALHDCNRDLVKRVTELETNLEKCQEKWQDAESLLQEKTQELSATQKQVSRLFYKLEVANEIIQRQEVLAETLRENWEKSQARQGHLERECALTQQRYNDVCYQAMELENNCRELRSRLYRQQRQTLQFKTALERSLEMPGVPPRDVVQETTATIVETQSQPASTEATKGSLALYPTANKIVSMANAESVKPWSSQLQKETPKENESHNLAINLEKKPSSPPTPTPTPNPTSSEKDPELSDSETRRVKADLPSFVETVSEVDSQQTVFQYVAEAAGGFPEGLIDEEQLWDFQEEARAEMPPVENEISTTPKSDRISWNLATGEWNTDKSTRGDRSVPPPPVNSSTVTQEAENWTPPTIYPVHSRKKRQSLAAIDLPTFPRSETPSAANG